MVKGTFWKAPAAKRTSFICASTKWTCHFCLVLVQAEVCGVDDHFDVFEGLSFESAIVSFQLPDIKCVKTVKKRGLSVKSARMKKCSSTLELQKKNTELKFCKTFCRCTNVCLDLIPYPQQSERSVYACVFVSGWKVAVFFLPELRIYTSLASCWGELLNWPCVCTWLLLQLCKSMWWSASQ